MTIESTTDVSLLAYISQKVQRPPEAPFHTRPRSFANIQTSSAMSSIITGSRAANILPHILLRVSQPLYPLYSAATSSTRRYEYTTSSFRSTAWQGIGRMLAIAGKRPILSETQATDVGGPRGMKVRSSVKKLCDGCKVRQESSKGHQQHLESYDYRRI